MAQLARIPRRAKRAARSATTWRDPANSVKAGLSRVTWSRIPQCNSKSREMTRAPACGVPDDGSSALTGTS